jgi:2-polyprenyl-6-methoxyphenol hydroxylase-like FAD-dependent oxidoreductase
MRRLEVAIAGCGPGGLAAALLLQAQGHRVTIFERFAEPGPVGSGIILQPTGLAVLARLGLAEAALARGSRIDRLHGLARDGRLALSVRYRGDRFGIGIHRATLFALLHDAAVAAGIPVVTGHTVVASEDAPEGRYLIVAEAGTVGPFDLVVDMLGARSPLVLERGRVLPYGAVWTNVWAVSGFDPHALAQRYDGAGIMAGVLPVGTPPGAPQPQVALFWSLRTDRLSDWYAAGLDAWRDAFAALWPEAAPLLEQVQDPAQLTFAHYAHRTLRRPVEPRLIHLGDAWHATSPQLGQGANMALLDAWALARALAAHDDLSSALGAAVRARRGHVRLYQAISRVFTPVYQSDSRVLPWLRDRLVRPAAAFGPTAALQAAMVSGTFGGPLQRLGLA